MSDGKLVDEPHVTDTPELPDTPELTDSLALLALGLLHEDDALSVRSAVVTGEADGAVLADYDRLVGALVECAELAPPMSGLSRLQRSVAEVAPSEALVDVVARLVDAHVDRARHLLRLISDDAAWLTYFPGLSLLHVRPGPRLVGADVGFVALDPGLAFPTHTHLGPEAVLVVAGTLHDASAGTVHGPGSVVEMAAGTTHDVVAGPEARCVYLAVTHGIEIPFIPVPEPPPALLW